MLPNSFYLANNQQKYLYFRERGAKEKKADQKGIFCVVLLIFVFEKNVNLIIFS